MITQKTYDRIHKWLVSKHGKAKRCQNKDCPKTSSTFNWCLKWNKEYKKDRNNFLQMCNTCHTKYDKNHKYVKKYKNSMARIKVKPSLLKKLKILAAQRQMSIGKLIEYEIFVAQN